MSAQEVRTESPSLWPARRLDPATAEAIEALRSTLRAAEIESEDLRRLPPAAVEAMAEAGVFKTAVPRELGGWEADALREFEIVEAVSRLSTSAGWSLAVACFHTSLPVVLLPSEEAVREIIEGPALPVGAGFPGSVGKARLVDGGMVVNGRYSWGSGILHAGWVIGGCNVEGDEVEAPRRVWVAPRDSVRIIDNWHVTGLRGTGSVDYEADDLFVPDGWWFPFGDPGPLTDDAPLLLPDPRRGGRKYRVPIRVWPLAAHIGVLLGAAERALELGAETASRKRRRMAAANVGERPVFQHDLATWFVRLSATRDNAMRLFGTVAELAAAEEPVTKDLILQIYGLAAHSAKTATAVAQMAYGYGGSSAVRLDSPLQQVLRDLLVAQQHLLYTDSQLEQVGEWLVDRAAATDER
ncbi:MAG: acyl-CoA dehydrogenase family protein [Solirubrobacterales bacterium]